MPAGFQLVRHPSAYAFLPADWKVLEEPPLAALDPDAVELVTPDAPEDVQVGASLWRYDRPTEEGRAWSPIDKLVLEWRNAPDYRVLRREPLEVTGTTDGYIIQARATAAAMEGKPEIFMTYAAGYVDGSVMVLQIVGPRDMITPDEVETAVDSFTIT